MEDLTRAVFDPNVLVSARVSPRGTPARLLEAAEEGRFELIVSNRVLEEVRDVLGRPKMRRYLPHEAVPVYLQRLRSTAALVADSMAGSVRGATTDPDDDYLVALVAFNSISHLVSGDRHLLGLPYRLVRDGEGRVLARVLTPREFLEELERMV